MLNKNGLRELCYVVLIDDIRPIEGKDRVECAVVGGWTVMVRKGQFNVGDPAIYFEVDSKVPEKEPFMFLSEKHFKIKIQKYGQFYSQGLLMHAEDFGWKNITGIYEHGKVRKGISKPDGTAFFADDESRFVTKELEVTYATKSDRARKSDADKRKYDSMAARNQNLFRKKPFRWLMRREWGRKLLFIFFGKKRDNNTSFPTKFPYVKKTDQERCENMTWVLNDKTPFITTEKCDGSSATYILERKRWNKFEFYVCSRNVRMYKEDQKCFHDRNYYWEAAKQYDIENKLKDYLTKHPNLQYVCWQGELCGPSIQANPHKLNNLHLFLFHFIDSEIGKYDIIKAEKIWDYYHMEYVPILGNIILPDDFEQFKESADGFYDVSVTEGKKNIAREGFVYYKTDDPNFSFKNVSRKYLMKHKDDSDDEEEQ